MDDYSLSEEAIFAIQFDVVDIDKLFSFDEFN
jgi:hypothetical protein